VSTPSRYQYVAHTLSKWRSCRNSAHIANSDSHPPGARSSVTLWVAPSNSTSSASRSTAASAGASKRAMITLSYASRTWIVVKPPSPPGSSFARSFTLP
jgi:hypothetical protein